MQISEIKTKTIYKICNFSRKYFKCLYIADSLGSLKKKQIKFLINKFKKNWPYEMGIHAHDNQSLALENTLFANRNGLNWLDSTVAGMGRGPGNTKTEELIKFFEDKSHNHEKAIKNLLTIFLKLKENTNGEPMSIIVYQVNIKFILPIFKLCFQIQDIKNLII